jgi:Flp pilus assembly protein TadG
MRAKAMMRRLRRFGRDRSGSITIEMLTSVLVINMLLLAFYYWWQTYSYHALVDRMTYTVNDLITRQRGLTLERRFLDGLETTAEFILDPDQDAKVRFTQVTMRPGDAPGDPPYIAVDWSYSPCQAKPMAMAGPGFDAQSLPMMAVGASMIVTEVEVPFTPDFDLIPELTFERRAVSLYRFEMRFDLEGDGTSTCID